MKSVSETKHTRSCRLTMLKANVDFSQYNVPAKSTWNDSFYFDKLYEVLQEHLDDYGFKTYARYCTKEQLTALIDASKRIPNIWRVTDWSKVPLSQLQNYIIYIEAGFKDDQLLRSTLSLMPWHYYKTYENLKNPNKAMLLRKYGAEFSELIPVLQEYESNSIPREVYEHLLFVNSKVFHHANIVFHKRTGKTIPLSKVIASDSVFNKEQTLNFFLIEQLGKEEFNRLSSQKFNWNSESHSILIDMLAVHNKHNLANLFGNIGNHNTFKSILKCLQYSDDILTYLALNMTDSELYEISEQSLKLYKKNKMKKVFVPLINWN